MTHPLDFVSKEQLARVERAREEAAREYRVVVLEALEEVQPFTEEQTSLGRVFLCSVSGKPCVCVPHGPCVFQRKKAKEK